MTRSMLSRALPVLAVLSLAVAGCAEPEKGTVKGKVTYKDAPVSGYVVNLVWKEKGFAASAPVGDDGNFALIDQLEAGTYTVFLTQKPPEPQPPGTPPKKTAADKIPAKYTDAAQSDLTVTVKGGVNDAPLVLKD